jgi:hypothetical protein
MPSKDPDKHRNGLERAASPVSPLLETKVTANLVITGDIGLIILQLIPKQASTAQMSERDGSE